MNKPKKSGPLLEAISEIVEAGVDFAVSNEAIVAVPIVGAAYKIVQALDDYRARILRTKLERFLTEPSLHAAAEARKLSNALLVDDEHDQEIGETLLLVLDAILPLLFLNRIGNSVVLTA